jgi:serine/threonine protein kinase/tetratricopeptide (TPR) repeat protein
MIQDTVKATIIQELVQAALTEQRREWTCGKRIAITEWLQRYPALSADPAHAAELVYHEFILRQELGESPNWDDYVRQFPEYAGSLVLLRQADQLLERVLLDPAPAAHFAARFDDYDILGEIGRGGMGIVFKARQRSLNRIVALKMIRLGEFAGPEEQKRFDREAQAIARLHHPNIVQIYEAGEVDGQPFLSLEFVEGESLARRLNGTPWPASVAAALVEQLARAMHYAHEKGVVHRDLKPGNILLLSSCPKITDFGLAKLAAQAGAQTETAAGIGTPSYMAPEQAEAKHGPVNARSDVYGLGAILYELLTGRPPFRADTPLETLKQVASADPARPRLLYAAVPRDLETVCLKCLEKEPARRYATAAALAEDLGQFARGEPVTARPVGAWGRSWRWCRRNPTMAALAGLLGLVLIAGLSGIFAQWRRTNIARQEAIANEEEVRQLLGEMIDFSPISPLMDYSLPILSTEPLTKAAQHCRSLLQKRPGDLDVRIALTNVYGRLGTLHLHRWQLDEMASCFRDARILWEPVSPEVAASAAWRTWLATTCFWEASGADTAGHGEQSVEPLLMAQATLEDLAQDQPDNLAFLERLTQCRSKVRNLVTTLWATDECRVIIDRETEALSSRLAHDPANRTLRTRLGLMYLARGDFCQLNHEMTQASSYWRQAYDQYRALNQGGSQGTSELFAKSLFAVCCSRLMGNDASDPMYIQANDLLEESGQGLDRLVKENPASRWLCDARSENLCLLILCHAKAGQSKKAEQICQSRMHELLIVPDQGRAEDEYDLMLVVAADRVASTLWQAGLHDRALSIARQAAALTVRYASLPARDPGFVYRLAGESVHIAALLRRLGDPAAALQQAEQGRRLMERYCRATPTTWQRADELCAAWVHVAKARWELGRRDEALAAFRESTTIHRQAFESQPSIHANRFLLSRSYDRLAYWNGLCGNWSAVADALHEREKLWPGNYERLNDVSKDFADLAEMIAKQPQPLSAQDLAARRTYLAESARAKSAAQQASSTRSMKHPLDNGARVLSGPPTATDSP